MVEPKNETTAIDALKAVATELERAIFELHHSVDPSKTQQFYYKTALTHVNGAISYITKAEALMKEKGN